MELLKAGDKMYVYGSMYISRGSDDTAGGLATIKEVKIDERLGVDHMNGIMVTFEELPSHGYNYKNLMEQQEKLSKEYAGKIAHPCPDIDTPWIEDGDFVNGQVYRGKSIW